MTSDETVVLARTEYDALIDRNEELEDRLAALDADDGSRVPHHGGSRHHARQESRPGVPKPPWRHTA